MGQFERERERERREKRGGGWVEADLFDLLRVRQACVEKKHFPSVSHKRERQRHREEEKRRGDERTREMR